MVEEKSTPKTINPLEPFLLLAKNARGAAAAHLITQVTEAPAIFTFGELLAVEGIAQLEGNEAHAKEWKLLQLFTFGVYTDYIDHVDNFPSLSENQIKKLRLLTIASLASTSKHVSYSLLMEKLGLHKLREVEDLIIEAVYAHIIKGKLNQKEQRLEVDFVIGRDIQPQMIDNIISILNSWRDQCESAMSSLEAQITRGNDAKEVKTNQKKAVEEQVENIKKTLLSQDETLNRTPLQDLDVESSNQQRSSHKLKALKSSLKSSSSRTR
jgi:COP9 signalosome complex subunit 7